MTIDFGMFTSLKGEFEAEGFTREDVTAQALMQEETFLTRRAQEAERTLPTVGNRPTARQPRLI